MGIYRRLFRRFSSLALFVFLISPPFSPFQKSLQAGSDQADFEYQAKELLEGKELYLRERVNSSPKVYCNDTGQPGTYFIQEEGRLLNLGKKAKVKITGVKHYRAQKQLKVKFKHEKLGKGSIDFYWPRDAVPTVESLKKMVRLAFCETEQNDNIILFVGNRESKRLHFIGCNHLPESSLQERFSNLDAAIQQGYRMCEICFRRNVVLADVELENYLSSMVTSQVLSKHKVNPNDSINDLVRRLGEKVLNNWPTVLRGYKYSFTVLESNKVNACAAPGGKIFIHSGLIDAIETENELVGILAHEITHVERRHGIRQYYKKKSRAFWTALAAAALGVGVEAATGDAGLGAFVFQNFLDVAVLAHKIALSGYGWECEIEADYYAIAFMKSMGDNNSYSRIMRKLQYNSNVNGYVHRKRSAFATHPDIDQRVQFAENARIQVYPANMVFVGYSKSGEEVAEIRFEAQCVSQGDVPLPKERQTLTNFQREGFQKYETVTRLKLFATLSATAELEEVSEIKEIKVITGGTVHKLDNKEDTRLFPLYEIGCTFENDSDKLLGKIDRIELKLRNVAYWERM